MTKGYLELENGEVVYIDKWSAMICFPPCTHLAVSGAAWFEQKIKDGRQQQGVDFFMKMINAPIERITIENPMGIMSTIYRKPDQIIQPYYFGDEAQKTTCLWLKNLPLLKPTNIVEPIKKWDGKRWRTWVDIMPKHTGKARSITFLGIAEAMAKQWG